MENVLDLYEKPYDEKFPVVRLDEFSKQLLEDKTAPIPMKPNREKAPMTIATPDPEPDPEVTQPLAPIVAQIQATEKNQALLCAKIMSINAMVL